MQTAPVDLVQKLLSNAKAWSSVEIEVEGRTTQHTAVASGGTPTLVMNWRYIETDRGQRKLREAQVIDGSEKYVTEAFGDGKRTATVRSERDGEVLVQKTININRSFYSEVQTGYVERPVPLSYGYVGLTPIREAISDSKSLGDEQVLGRNCRVQLFPKIKGRISQDLIYWLDAESAIALRVEAHPEGKTAEKRPSWRWEATKIETFQSHPLVSGSRYVSLDRTKDDGKSVKLEIDYSTRSVRFDQRFPADIFWYKAEPGVHVVDSITGKVFDTPGKSTATITPSETLTATPPDDGWILPAVTWTSLVIAGSLVALIVFRKIRARQQ